MRLQDKKKIDADIPTASMADIAFLLIVFFMLTTVFSANKGLEHVLPPKEDSDNITPDESVYIQIFPGGQFAMDKTTYPMDQVDTIYNYVSAKVQNNPNKPIIVHANRESSYGDMVLVLDQLKLLQVNMKQPLAITIPSKEEALRYQNYIQ